MILEQLLTMAHSPVRNYAIPGLTSWLIGGKAANGSLVRLFHMSRQHVEPLHPHSHRFDFVAKVLRGRVTNRVWSENNDGIGDKYVVSREEYLGQIGDYHIVPHRHAYFEYDDFCYEEGEEYRMDAREIHSIYFDKDTYVLMFEGPKKSDFSEVLEPEVDMEHVRTFKVEPWMFQRDRNS